MTKNNTVRLTPEIMAAAMARMAPEGGYSQCPTLDDFDFEHVAKLEGADFAAGDLAREAVDRGFDPNSLVHFFIGEFLPLARHLARPGLTACQLAELRARPHPTETTESIDKANVRCRVLAISKVGIARSIIAGDFDLSDEDNVDRLGGFPSSADEKTEMVEAADAIAKFALDLVTEEDKAEVAEMSARGLTRHFARASRWSGHLYSSAEMVERLRVYVGAPKSSKLPAPSRAKTATKAVRS